MKIFDTGTDYIVCNHKKAWTDIRCRDCRFMSDIGSYVDVAIDHYNYDGTYYYFKERMMRNFMYTIGYDLDKYYNK